MPEINLQAGLNQIKQSEPQKKQGYIVTYENDRLQVFKAIVYYHEQEPFEKHGRAMLRLVNYDLTFKYDLKGRKVIAMRRLHELTVIGYID